MRVTAARTAVVLLGGLSGIGAWASCVDLASLGNGPPRLADAGVAVADPCVHAVPTPRPERDDGSDVVLPPFEVAIDQVVLDPSRARGYDLDGLCTCDTRAGSIADGGGSCARGPGACDLDGGVDNAAGIVAQNASATVPIDRLPNRLLASGRRSLLIQLQKYNGRANDKEVVVGTIFAEGIRSRGCPSSVLDPATGFYSPGRCGDDAWTIASGAVIVAAGTKVPLATGTGHVNQFQLVVRIANPVTLPFSEVRGLAFHDALLTAKIVPLGEDLAPRDPAREPTPRERRLFRLEDGILTGRVATDDTLRAIGSYTSSAGPLCKTSAFELVRTGICDARDVVRDVRSTPDPTRSCDAISAAFGFTAVPATIDELTDAPVPSDPCADVDAAVFACP